MMEYVRLGDEVDPSGPLARRSGWGEDNWSEGREARVFLRLSGESLRGDNRSLELIVAATTFFTQTVDISVNGQFLGTVATAKGITPDVHRFEFEAEVLRNNPFKYYARDVVEISSEIREPLRAVDIGEGTDRRTLGISVASLVVREKSQD